MRRRPERVKEVSDRVQRRDARDWRCPDRDTSPTEEREPPARGAPAQHDPARVGAVPRRSGERWGREECEGVGAVCEDVREPGLGREAVVGGDEADVVG